MIDEQWFLISILADHLQSQSSVSPEGLNWQKLFVLSEQHQVSGIVYAQCKNPFFRHAYFGAIANYLKRKEAMALLEVALRKHDIEYFMVKGPIIAENYPMPALRTMGDVDVVVHPEDRGKVRNILCELGFRIDEPLGIYEWHLYYSNLMFELHDHLMYDEVANEEIDKSFFNDCWEYVMDGALDPNFHFLFLIVHLRKHFINSGIGFRQFMDIVVMMRGDLNWPWIEKKLRVLELWNFSEKIFALIRVWFGVELPLVIKSVDQIFIDEATAMILNNGVFGFDNEENEHNSAVSIVMAEGSSFISRSRRVLNSVFYPYSKLILKPQHSYLINENPNPPAMLGRLEENVLGMRK